METDISEQKPKQKPHPGNKLRKVLILLLVIAANITADQITKAVAVNRLQGKPPIRMLGGIAVLTYAENTGAFLSLGSNLPPKVKTILLMIAPGVVIIGAALYMFLSTEKISGGQLAAIGCLMAGGASNLYDRIVHQGAVVDFMHIGIGRLRTGIFNIADISIMFGGIFLFIIILIDSKKSPKEPGQTQN